MLELRLFGSNRKNRCSAACACVAVHSLELLVAAQEAHAQAQLSVPLATIYCLNVAQTFISLAVIGQLGTQELAAASIALHALQRLCKVPLLALNGALDTQASQVCVASQQSCLDSAAEGWHGQGLRYHGAGAFSGSCLCFYHSLIAPLLLTWNIVAGRQCGPSHECGILWTPIVILGLHAALNLSELALCRQWALKSCKGCLSSSSIALSSCW